MGSALSTLVDFRVDSGGLEWAFLIVRPFAFAAAPYHLSTGM